MSDERSEVARTFAERSVSDAFKSSRGSGASVIDKGETIPIILGYRAVREAAKDWKTYSSDAPLRVPIPSEENVRTVRQLPIETDPPQHTALRALVAPMFRRPMQADYVERLDTLVEQALSRRGSVDLVREVALPLQSRALALLLGMPQSEADTWIGWGTHVFHDGDDPSAKGSVLDDYLREQIAKARGTGEEGDDLFSILARAELDGRGLSDDDILGFANLAFAGGRDTVINCIAVMLHHFAHHRAELEEIAPDTRRTNLAVEEFVRAVSPLTHIGRVAARPVEVGGCPVAHGERVSLCWAAANYDPDVFDAPETLHLDRSPNAHVGFGSGPHACLGAPQARALLRALIRGLARHTSRIDITDAVPNVEALGDVTRYVGFETLQGEIHG